jgi:tripartite-type tricarboxylate transporter receptor subunit TctC
MEFVAKQEGIEWTMIPFPAGVGASTSALLGGNITAVSGSPEIIPHVKAGSIRILATHGERRMKSLPEVPTFRELGYDYVTESMFMYAAPKGTPLSIVKKLEDAFHKAMDDPLFSKAMDKFEIEIIYRNSEETMKYLEEAYVRTEKMIKDFRIMKETEKK